MGKSIGIILKEKRLESGLSVKEISSRLTSKGYKASEKTIYSWESGNSQPNPDALLEMCDAYGIEDILKTFGYNGYKKDGSIQLNMKEQSLVEKYRSLDDTGKTHVDYVLNWESGRIEQLKEKSDRITELEETINKNNIVEMPVSYQVSAAHERTDIEVTDEMRKYDDNIMDDENF